MKKSFLALASFAAIAVACQIEKMDSELPLVDDAVVYTASTEAYAPATKTAMDGHDVVWSAGDQIAVFQGNTYYDVFQVTSASAGKTEATFTLKSDKDASNEALPYNGAFYPVYESMESYSEGDAFVVWNFALPTTQKYAAGSFANGAFPMIAVSEDNQFEFNNVLGALKLNLTGNRTVKSITVIDNAGNQLAGKARVYLYEDDAPELTFEMSYDSPAPSSVTLDCGEGVKLNANTATEFVIALPATEFENGFTVLLTDAEYNVLRFQASANDKNRIERSKILSMPALDVESLTQDVEFRAVPSLNDITLDISVNVEGSDGFYGSVMSELMWNLNIKPMIENDAFDVNALLSNQYAFGGAPACKYDNYSGTMVTFGWTDEYISYDMYNMIEPNTKYIVLIIPAFADKDAALNQGGGEEDDLGGMPLMSLYDEDTPDVAGYTMEDVLIYEVSTQCFTTDGVSTLSITKEEGYTFSSVEIAPSEDVIGAYYRSFGEGDALPNKDNYLDEFEEYLDAYYDPTSSTTFQVSINYNEYPVGSNNKIGVILVDEFGRSSFHLIDLALLPIPVSSEPLTVTFGDYGYDETERLMYAEITAWPEDAEIYYMFGSHTSGFTGDDLKSAQADILDGAFSYKLVADSDIVDGVIYLEKTQSQLSYAAQTKTLHVIIVKDGKIGEDNSVTFTIPKATN